MLIAGLGLAGLLLPGAQSAPSDPGQVVIDNAAEKLKRGKRGRVGPPGVPGPQGEKGIEGPPGRLGDQGATGSDAGAAVTKRFISINWENNNYSGKVRQNFVAPGIGEGYVKCRPPTGALDTGEQLIQFFPYDASTKQQPPKKWATTMWTLRAGGKDDADNPSRSRDTGIRTARIDRANQEGGFYESMNGTQVGTDPVSTGTFTGMISTEPFSPGTQPPAPTSFQLSWHWNFDTTNGEGSRRCFVAGVFVTEKG